VLAGSAASNAALAKVGPEAADAIENTGIYASLLPGEDGRTVESLREFVGSVVSLAEADAGAAWGTALLAVNNWLAAKSLGIASWAEVSASPGGPRVAGTFARREAVVQRVHGGYRIESGIWGFNSGIYQANWDLISLPLPAGYDRPAAEAMAIVPRADILTLDDWDVIGMRASGSTSISLKNVFVPDHRVVDLGSFLGGGVPAGQPEHWLWHVSTVPLLSLALVLPALGAGSSLVAALAGTGAKPVTYAPISRRDGSAGFLRDLGAAAARVAAARSIVDSCADLLEQRAKAGVSATLEERARVRRDVALAAELLWQAGDAAMTSAGGSGLVAASAWARHWHDIKVTSLHALVAPSTSYELYGRVVAGVDIENWLV
jgi:alkylation response protein AidB-like acyl-CoA dehydrogenase